MTAYLFSSESLRDFIQQRVRDAANAVNGFDVEEILQKPADDLADVIVAHNQINIPELKRDAQVLSEPKEITQTVSDYGRSLNVPAMQLTLSIPFEGNGRLFTFQPNSYTSAPPIGRVTGNNLILTVSGRNLIGDQVRNTFEKTISEIEQYLGWQRALAASHNASLRPNALKQIEERKQKLLTARSMAASIGYNMKPVLPYPTTHRAVQIQRKATPVGRQPKETFKSEPELVEDDYQHILGIIESMAKVMERSPGSFVHLGEEDIRQHFLVPLNGHYKGDGTAEAFNSEGKTDILIRVEDRNIFIAECKIWDGEKICLEAIDQLLSYLSWRDTKTCLIMFSRLKNFTYMLGELWRCVEAHPNFKRKVAVEGETRHRYVFRNALDPDRELSLTVLAFNVPKA